MKEFGLPGMNYSVEEIECAVNGKKANLQIFFFKRNKDQYTWKNEIEQMDKDGLESAEENMEGNS